MTRKIIICNGLKLLLVSIVFRIIAFIFFSFSWEWENYSISVIEIVVGIVFVSIWFVYGFRKKLGFKRGIIIGLIGASDAIILLILSLILYINRGSYYFGPIELAVWGMPLFGIINAIDFISDTILILAPFIVIFLSGIGGHLGKINKRLRIDETTKF